MAVNFKSPYPCLCCGHDVDNEVTYHHEYSQGSHPEHKWAVWNLVSVCLKHHNEIHDNGSVRATKKYARLENWFYDNGWTILKLELGVEKWVHDLEVLHEDS